MRDGYKEIIENASFEVDYAEDCLEKIALATDNTKLWMLWAGILDHYVKAVSAMRRATDQGSSKAWSDRLIARQKADPILQYARQARDQANHVFEMKRKVGSGFVSVGSNAIRIGGSSKVFLSNNLEVDRYGVSRKLPEGFLVTVDGRYAGGTIPKKAITETRAYVVIEDVANRSGIWSVPNPDTAPEKRAVEIAEYLVMWLKNCLDEVKELSTTHRG
ncbi:hypothetical protein [Notoacmeibacter marinus]|uniref:hypothetical protein n=1 Tax=Notoacmeibacter marinus TaxID=1876515 RepID=UPI000DF1BE99|nr:hypothetical protein [Notoacmeibacter marinus]